LDEKNEKQKSLLLELYAELKELNKDGKKYSIKTEK